MSDIDYVRRIRLVSITMQSCQAERGPGRQDGSVRLETEAAMQASQDGDALSYFVRLNYTATDGEGMALITGSVVLALAYSLEVGFEPTSEQLEHYATGGVAFQAHPYLREHVMSMCTRAGLPPYALPILGRDETTPVMEEAD